MTQNNTPRGPWLPSEITISGADLRLYQAAPDMLAALQMIESCLAPEDNDAAARAVRAAIARATEG